MTVRQRDDAQPTNVIPLRPNGFRSAAGVDKPEPSRLYHLTVLAFLLHTPIGQWPACACCGQRWPCGQVRLAYRLREGF
jgi:hypothetical protein